MMMLQTLWDVLIFAAFVFGVGAACAPRWPSRPLLSFLVGTAGAVGLAFLVGFAGFALGGSNALSAAAVALTGIGVLVARRRSAAALLAHADVRHVVTAWFIFAGWALGLLALVVTFSGGGWCVDWVEHWQRTMFFVNRDPLSTRFVTIYSLTARPPLANLVVALFLESGRVSFAQFQVFLTLLGSLVVLPCFVLATRWRGNRTGGWWVLLLLMLSPLVAENLTFSWTKLPTAFFVLVAVCLALEIVSGETPRSARGAAAACLALAMVTHYSAGPWLIGLALGFIVAQRPRWREASFWREIVGLAAVFAVVLGLWVGWALAEYGWAGTFEANSTTEAWHKQTTAQRLATPLLNLRDTIVPFPLRGEPGGGLIMQQSRLGRLRDMAFNVYQVNLVFAIGMAGVWVLAQALRRRWSRPRPATAGPAGERTFLLTAVPIIVVTGVGVHTMRDHWGLTHICLQPLVLMALAAAAAALPRLSPAAKGVWAVLAAIDFGFGVVLQFGFESWRFAPLVTPSGSAWAFVRQLNAVATGNAIDKWTMNLRFFADRVNAPVFLVVLWLALCFGTTIVRLRTTPSPLVHG